MTSFIKVPFASSGDKVAVPDTDTGGGVNMTQGYGQAYSLDPATDPSAKRIERDKMNWLFNRITQAINEIQSGGVAPFITSADNGGSAFSYGKGALVSLGGVVYQSLVASNTSTPPGANWSALPEKMQPLDATLTALAGLVGAANKLPYFNGADTATLTDLTSVGRDIIGKADVAAVLTYLGINETINPSKRVSIGALGTGVFDGSKPAINIGDSDSGFVFESDGVIGVYANSQKIAELTNTEYKIIGNLSLTNGALLLGGLTHFIRHTDADDAGFAGNNVEIGSWNGIGLTCTYDGTTRIYFNTRTGEVGLKGPLKADGNVYSGDAWLDQTGNVQGSLWGSGVGLKGYLDNTFNKKNTASLNTNGWQRDESTGLITQWGLIDGANGTYNFPRAFLNQCFAVLVTNTSTQGFGVDNAFGYPLNNSQFFAGSKNDGGGIGPYPVAFLAFGK
uniref:gp53-like domain-containing protein n=1 Tax=Citrobacter freundii TaxID=546 RepID=UPI002016EE55|nr:tail fiber protein [Citrobacter freundii]